jgi:hypothetical protein
LKVLEGVINDELERTDLVTAMALVVADTTNHAFVDALRFEADEVEHLSDVAFAFGALGVLELFTGHQLTANYYMICRQEEFHYNTFAHCRKRFY